MQEKTLIPARGIVEFLLHPMDDDEFVIDGPKQWARPVVGLVIPSFYDAQDVTRRLRAETPWDRQLPFEPVVVDECGLLFTAHDYLAVVMRGDCWEDGSYFYRPHLDGPVTDAPRVRRPKMSFCPCGCLAEVTQGSHCTAATERTYTLVSGVEMHNQYPDTFWIPSEADKNAVAPGDHVQLIFASAEGDMPERMWVKCTAAGARFTGRLDNVPFDLEGIGLGDVVEFGPEHIIQIADSPRVTA